MPTLISDLTYALRLFRRTPGFALVVVLLLAIGMGASTAMFSILDAWLLEPLHFPEADRLTIVLKAEAATPSEPKIFDGYRDWEQWERKNRSFSKMAAVMWRNFEAPQSDSGDAYGMIATYNLFDTLGLAPERGRTFTAQDRNGPPVAVIGHELWKTKFGGTKDIIGKTVTMGLKTYRILGVMPPGFDLRMMNQPGNTQFYALIQGDEEDYRTGAQGPLAAIGRLKPGVSMAAAQSDLAAVEKRTDQRYPDSPKGFVPLVLNLQANNTHDLRDSLDIAAAAVTFVLLIVCANVGSLLLGRTMQRQTEMAIRAALGSGKLRIVRQLLTESAVLAVAGAGLGLLLAYGGVRAFAALDPFGRMPPNPIVIHWRALAFAAGAGILSTLIFGLAPALHAARQDLNEMMKAAGRSLSSGASVFRARFLLVAAQVTLSLVLLVAAALMIQTLGRLAAHPLGFRIADVSVADIGWPRNYLQGMAERQRTYKRVLESLRAAPGVEAAAISNVGPLSHEFDHRFSIEGQPELKEEIAPKAASQAITPGWFRVLDIPLLEGRTFNDADTVKARRVAIVNQSVARKWFAGASPVGRRIRFGRDKEWATVVGVTGDTFYSFYNTVAWLKGPLIYFPEEQALDDTVNPARSGTIAAIRGRALTAETVRQVLKSVDPGLRLHQFKTMDELVSDAMQQPRIRSTVLSAFAILALLLAGMGMYALMTQSVIQRKHEIGIRMALGASARDLVEMIVLQALWLALAGVAVGALGAWAVARGLAGLLYEVKPADAATFCIAIGVLLGSAILAALLPARAATKVDPTRMLRLE